MLERSPRRFDAQLRGTKVALVALACILALLAGAACGGEPAGGGQGPSGGDPSGGGSGEGAASGSGASGETTAAQEVGPEETELARARVGKKEMTNMIPADGKRPDRARPLPENPPDGTEVYPATTNKTVKGPIRYDRQPPTNGDHAPIWLNCGFYEKPVQDRYAVHSMDHGVVWITYRPGLPSGQVDGLRPYGEENYVIVSPYPGQDAPVIATSWRVQLELDGADDPRLRQFVDQFRVSELAPLSGNRCTGGVGG
jgi:Protein of unknown function (DUF3105)